MNQEHHNFEIMKCLKTEGRLQPGEIHYIEFIFHPLESIRYEVDVPITVDGGKTKMISFSGEGLEDRVCFPHLDFDNGIKR